MFFSVSKFPKNNFSKLYKLGPFDVYTDEGWRVTRILNQEIVYKGYANSGNLGQLLPDILNNDQPQLLGNFCAIIYNPSTKTIKIKTDRYRSFPIYIHEQSEITNLSKSTKVVWADSLINVGAAYVHWEVKFDAVVPIDTSAITLDQALTEISQILDKSTQDFLSNNHLPVRVHLSGGKEIDRLYKKYGGEI